MTQADRTMAFFATMLLTFGITAFNFENPSFESNIKEYLLIAAGLIFTVIFVIRRIKAK